MYTRNNNAKCWVSPKRKWKSPLQCVPRMTSPIRENSKTLFLLLWQHQLLNRRVVCANWLHAGIHYSHKTKTTETWIELNWDLLLAACGVDGDLAIGRPLKRDFGVIVALHVHRYSLLSFWSSITPNKKMIYQLRFIIVMNTHFTRSKLQTCVNYIYNQFCVYYIFLFYTWRRAEVNVFISFLIFSIPIPILIKLLVKV